MNIFRICYVFFATLIGLLLLYQQSITVYWQQTYHQAMPLSSWQEKPFFLSIAKLNQWLLNKEDVYFSAVEHINIQMVEQYNHLIITDDLSQNHSEVVNNNESNNDLSLEDEIKEIPAVKQQEIPSQSTFIQTQKGSTTNTSSKTSDEVSNKIKTENEALADAENEKKSSINQLEAVKKASPIMVQPTDKILFIGDSLMQGVAPRVKRALYQKYHIESLDLSKQSTGLSYPGAFNWPKTVEDTLEQDPSIKVLVVFLGPNDPWDYPVKGHTKYLQFKSSQWEATYRYRINRILSAAQLNHTNVIWLGAPCMRKTKLHNDMLYLNTLYQSEVEKMDGHYVPTSELLGCSDNNYANFVTNGNGNTKVRIDDGIHFTVSGQRILANRIINEMIIEAPNQNKAIE
ncbi:SGNH family hydrolase [Orbus wheelerorum]|uniref:SGNH/GDSL hydrolase family protein n=1 Tax=Orbus wheelerorum TaxID=3074111 RepID=UPI00370D05E7